MRRALHAFLLILAFLFAQTGLTAHAAAHVTAGGHGSSQGLPADDGCELCVGHAQLANGAPMLDAEALPVCIARYEVPRSCNALRVTSPSGFSLARAPPVFS